VASHLRLPHHESTLNRSACIPRSRFRAVRVTLRHARCDQFRVEHLNLNAQLLQPRPEPKNGGGASPMTRQHRMLLDDPGGGLERAPRARL
jgi:hypothetical protein